MKRSILWLVAGMAILCSALAYGVATAATPPPGPTNGGSVGVEGVIESPPPTQSATIATPSPGQSFSTIPITVSGLCPANTLVKIFSNDILVGSAACQNGSYSLLISLFSGRNDLVARVFDALDQQGPDSAVVTVNFNDAQYLQFGSHVIITSQYARKAAQPNQEIEWPVIISSGLGPYALSVNWGDGSGDELRSEPFAGVINFKHVYKTPGVYQVTFKVADRNGTVGYLQVVAVIAGNVGSRGATNSGQTQKTIVTERQVLWWPMAIMLLPIIAAFLLGRKFEITKLRRRLE